MEEKTEIIRDILIMDIESDSLNTEVAKVKFFGAYSYINHQIYIYKGTEKEEIKDLLQRHRVLVGFNNKAYDNPILINNGYEIENLYKIFIDLYEISAQKGSGDFGHYNKNKLIQMGIDIKTFSLKNIINILKLDDAGTKGDIDYKIFQKDVWTDEELNEIKIYLTQDIMLTKKLFEWYEEQFQPLKVMLSTKSARNFKHIVSSLSSLGYEIICNKAGLRVEWGEKQPGVKHSFEGAHHINPRKEKVKGNICNIDFACLHKDTEVITPKGNKKISELQTGDKIKGVNDFEEIESVNKKIVNKLYKITLETGEIIYSTGEHKFPVKKIGDKRADELRIGDDMITISIRKKGLRQQGLRLHKKCVICKKDFLTKISNFNSYSTCSKKCSNLNRKGNKNSNYKNRLKKINCPVCNKEFIGYEYLNKSCSKECGNILKSKNNKRHWLGKTKENTPQLMKISLSKLGIKRTEKHKKNISNGTKIGMKKNWEKFIFTNKNRNKDFFKNPQWIIKNQQSRANNIKKGKWRYKGINFRSSWETKFAQLLDNNNIKWNYEKKLFIFNNEGIVIRYLPDFYLSEYDLWIEIKGWKSIKSMLKYNIFKKENKSLLIDDINQFENEIQKIKNKEY
jgi:predicted nucleic acid-binding Zn ribbon protein